MKYDMRGVTYEDRVFDPTKHDIFVFGSNTRGIHGAGAALHARLYYGALQGVGEGRQGGSYAIPTKDENIETLPLTAISGYVLAFLSYARANPGLVFFVTRIGCGLAGYYDEQIAPLFSHPPENVELPNGWR